MLNGIGTGLMNHTFYFVGKIKVPPVPKMTTKGQCKLSEKDLVKKIVKLAQSDAAAGKDSQHGATVFGVRVGTAEWKKLRDDYISFASPDRTRLINNTLSNLSGQAQSLKLTGKNRGLNIFNILFKNNKKFGPDVGGNFVKFRDEQGNEIAEYSEPNGWNMRYTPAESARNTAFYDLWKQALADAQEEIELEKKGEFIV